MKGCLFSIFALLCTLSVFRQGLGKKDNNNLTPYKLVLICLDTNKKVTIMLQIW